MKNALTLAMANIVEHEAGKKINVGRFRVVFSLDNGHSPGLTKFLLIEQSV